MLTFVELCAGTAAVSLRLHHSRARPPVSRMGAKTGYADTILRVLGLRPGQRADRYVWCEPDPGVRLLLHAYRDRELATAAADIIRGWKDEEPRALWERLRAEGPAVCPPVDPREVARLLTIMRWAYANVPIGHNGERFTIPANGPDAPLTFGANNFGTTETTATGLDKAPTLPATIADDARAIDPPQLPPGVVVYIDPPYQDTTGYAHDFARSEWLPLVRAWKASGATVCISEAEPIPDLIAEGWHAVEITNERKGQKRTFSKQQAEWLTLSDPPKWRPSVQQGLFAC